MPLNLDPQQYGTVYWLTGLAGAGKTTIGRLLAIHFRKKKQQVVFLDGDHMREVLGAITGHSPAERLGLAQKYAAMCRMLSRQGIDVICSTISMFHSIHDWNRDNIHNYVEIYLQVPMEVLASRDKKGLYSQALAGTIDNVIGVNAAFEEPRFPDIIVINDGSRPPDLIVSDILDRLQLTEKTT